MVDALSRSRIDIFVQVLQIDGGQRCAAINAATLALINAGVPLRDFVCASSVGYLEGSVLVDLNSVESNMGGPELVVRKVQQTKSVSINALTQATLVFIRRWNR
uniref:Exoribonuclease phosphorolytic domain-containing protein n=1 Tax=Compsopogon caeruleus TaxID=31354 RepID=A0A7S1TFN1_9RHOD|mmetsp:Transcript_4423/g.8728  ORF Transcript_4423/g.8728 Transcript_4423/m.8728 type:complete len:104 (+) Transcript_4423:1064-1375(+)